MWVVVGKGDDMVTAAKPSDSGQPKGGTAGGNGSVRTILKAMGASSMIQCSRGGSTASESCLRVDSEVEKSQK